MLGRCVVGDVANCPFCSSDIEEDLVVFGGTCPKCFGEIPGEEAPTDPGEERKAAIEKADQAVVRRRRSVQMVGALMLFLVMAGGALTVAFWPEEEAVLLNFDEEYYEEDLDGLAAYEAPEDEPESSASGIAKSTRTTKRDPLGNLEALKGLGKDGDVLDGVAVAEQVGPSTSGMRTSENGDINPFADDQKIADGVSGGAPMVGGLVPSVKINRQLQRGVTLTDDNQIIGMIRKVLSDNSRGLQTRCYEKELKNKPDLKGKWTLRFTVDTKGQVRDATAEGRDMQDASLEFCLVEQVSRWEFQAIHKAQPVQKSYTFRPG